MSQTNLELARQNMVEQQIRPWNVLNQKVLDLLGQSPRQDYMPEASRNLAYIDMNVPISHGQVMVAPKIEARLLQALEIKPSDKILEVGTGRGHLTSLLASLGKHVYSVELIQELSQAARQALADHNINNVTLEIGDAANGWESHKPYDVIIITGSVPVIPPSFKESLTVGGRMIAIVGQSPVMNVRLIERIASNNWIETDLFETDLPPLNNAKSPDKFVF